MNKQQLFAYYMAKHNMNGIQLDENEILEIVNVSKSTFRKNVARFRYLLSMEGNQRDDISEAMKKLYDELENKAVTQVRTLIIDAI